jgi:hypothetical protein
MVDGAVDKFYQDRVNLRGVFIHSDSFQRRKKSGFVTLAGIPSFRDVFRPLLAGDWNIYAIFLPIAD